MNGDLEEAALKHRRSPGHNHIAGQGEVHSRSHRRAVHRGHSGKRGIGYPQEPRINGTQAFGIVGGQQLVQVGPSGKSRGGAGDHYRPNRIICLNGVEGGIEFMVHVQADCVAHFRVVEGHGCHAVIDLGQYKGHVLRIEV